MAALNCAQSVIASASCLPDTRARINRRQVQLSLARHVSLCLGELLSFCDPVTVSGWLRLPLSFSVSGFLCPCLSLCLASSALGHCVCLSLPLSLCLSFSALGSVFVFLCVWLPLPLSLCLPSLCSWSLFALMPLPPFVCVCHALCLCHVLCALLYYLCPSVLSVPLAGHSCRPTTDIDNVIWYATTSALCVSS